MGCADSKVDVAWTDERKLKLAHALPPWCVSCEEQTDVELTADEIVAIELSWQIVQTGSSEKFKSATAATPRVETLSPTTFFFNAFYGQLFALLPEVKPLFRRSLQTQGRMLANILKFIVAKARMPDREFRASLEHLAAAHNEYGVRAEWYNVMGLVLLSAVRGALDDDQWTADTRRAWIKIYSRMMCVILPVVLDGKRVVDVRALAHSRYTNHDDDNKRPDTVNVPSTDQRDDNKHSDTATST